jgi:hypothetical protein
VDVLEGTSTITYSVAGLGYTLRFLSAADFLTDVSHEVAVMVNVSLMDESITLYIRIFITPIPLTPLKKMSALSKPDFPDLSTNELLESNLVFELQ